MHVAASQNGPSQATAGDSRVFPVGRILRRMRIDELPQLINVLRGEMSMVGPRPECIEYMEELSAKVPNYLERLGLKPGLTGIAQIEAGYANDLESYRRKVAFDLMYLQNCCVWNDLHIMIRTVRVVLTGFGAL
jgi:lipopolysaccharide/colanic/teichoic acid biosynthesis glycosyltransferase